MSYTRARASIEHFPADTAIFDVGGEVITQLRHVTVSGACLVLYTEVPHGSGVRPIYAVVPVKDIAELLVNDEACRAEIDLAIALRQLRIVQEAWAKAFGKEEAS